ncbi:MAG: hypothetical protein ACTSVF_05235 [Candidatus Asgardarchaeia archaeon]
MVEIVKITPLIEFLREKSGLNFSREAKELIHKYVKDTLEDILEELAKAMTEVCELCGVKTVKAEHVNFIMKFYGIEEE